MRFGRGRRSVNLALQGGGAHGAFTWGVIDRLLEDDRLDVGWISATSAGAVNAVGLAAGLLEGGREGARAKLAAVWEAVQQSGVPDLLKLNPFLLGLSRSKSFAQLASLFSPYDFNPLGFDPLRRLLEQHIDFEALRTREGPQLLIAATDVATGRARLFRRGELTVECVLASACLPMLHHAVTIDGRAYWDGGYSANPDLVTLAMESPIGDTLLVQLNPHVADELPTGARDIAAHVSNITFNQPLIRDVELLHVARQMRGNWFGIGRGGYRRLAEHRFHLIEAGRYTGALSADSKLKPERQIVTHLHSAGRLEAQRWLERHGRKIGRLESVDLYRHFHRQSETPSAPPQDARRTSEPADEHPLVSLQRRRTGS